MVPNVSSSPSADCVSPSFNSHPFRRSERIQQKNKVKKLNSALQVQFGKEAKVFYFDPNNIVQCNFVFPDGGQQQH